MKKKMVSEWKKEILNNKLYTGASMKNLIFASLYGRGLVDPIAYLMELQVRQSLLPQPL